MDKVPRKGAVLYDLDEVCTSLEQYFRSATRLLANGRFSLGQVEELASCVEEVRLLLQELGHYLCSPAGDDVRKATIRELRDWYLELEGMVKEIRNDLCLMRRA